MGFLIHFFKDGDRNSVEEQSHKLKKEKCGEELTAKKRAQSEGFICNQEVMMKEKLWKEG